MITQVFCSFVILYLFLAFNRKHIKNKTTSHYSETIIDNIFVLTYFKFFLRQNETGEAKPHNVWHVFPLYFPNSTHLCLWQSVPWIWFIAAILLWHNITYITRQSVFIFIRYCVFITNIDMPIYFNPLSRYGQLTAVHIELKAMVTKQQEFPRSSQNSRCWRCPLVASTTFSRALWAVSKPCPL